jgi:hypothetical protein
MEEETTYWLTKSMVGYSNARSRQMVVGFGIWGWYGAGKLSQRRRQTALAVGSCQRLGT